MPGQVVLVHGWSDDSTSFYNLRDFLVAKGYAVEQIWFGDYISMEDDVRIEDAARRMHNVISSLIENGTLTQPFDLIVHSTGGLVAREWIASRYPDGRDCPVKRVVMLAPANFGSRLAALGKSMIGRVAKGWNNWFQTGTQMLRGLELASPYQWQLARRDLLDPVGSGTGPYGAGKVWPFVIVGGRGYTENMRQIVNEDGSDGTVRVAAANLNAVGFTIDFSAGGEKRQPEMWTPRAGDIRFPFAVLPDRNHGTIVDPARTTGATGATAAVLGQLVLDALRCDTDKRYGDIAQEWDTISDETGKLVADAAKRSALLGKDAPKPEALHQFFQVVTYVRDDDGQPIEDYFLEFYAPRTQGSADIVNFQRDVLKDVHVNGDTGSLRCLFIDRENLFRDYYGKIPDPKRRQLAVSISAANPGRNIRYFDATREGAKGELIVHDEDENRRDGIGVSRLRRNTTHLVEIIVPRMQIDRVFGLSR